MNPIRLFLNNLSEIAFPPVCICCGARTEANGTVLCTWCCEERFEKAEFPVKEILPSSTESVFTMWNFDKGGYLQKILHELKYNHMGTLGFELGIQMALEMPDMFKLMAEGRGADPILIPVPLHIGKERKRGYNQAKMLASGIASLTGWELIPDRVIKRIRNTGTQTGLTREARAENVRNSFQVEMSQSLEQRKAIIVDDVFTTGATVFELAETLSPVTGNNVLIATVARA